MSLVVAKKIDNYLQIVSDSKLTAEEQIYGNPFLFGTLKTIITSVNTCISFAGLVEKDGINYPKIAFEKIFDTESMPLTDILEILTDVQKQSKYETDFIVAHQNDDIIRLIKIQNGQLYEGYDTFWIGDIDGFNVFQTEFLNKSSDKDLTGEEKSSVMFDAFTQVINNATVKSVDGLLVSIFNKNGYFEYLEGINLDIHKKTTIKPKQSKVLPFGEAEDGSFGIAYFTNEKDNPFAIATYFPQGRMGVLYAPQLSLERILIKDVSDEEFVKIIKEKYKTELSGFIIDLKRGQARYLGKTRARFKVNYNIQYTTSPSNEK